MGYSIFVTYKYRDNQVRPLTGFPAGTTVRSYVDVLDAVLTSQNHVYKGEDDGESLNSLRDSTISSKLGDKIFASSVTVILISKGMRDWTRPESDQWMPWEISYSLREQSRNGRNSKTNAMLAVVIPDQLGDYGHFFTDNPLCNSTTWHTNNVFKIIRDNMFNYNRPISVRECNGSTIYTGEHSFVKAVKWDDFLNSPNFYLDAAKAVRDDIYSYNISKSID